MRKPRGLTDYKLAQNVYFGNPVTKKNLFQSECKLALIFRVKHYTV